EQAHIANRDVLNRLTAAVLSSIQLPGVRRRLLRDLELALEQRCDFAAAKEVGCPVTVAETIVTVEKIFRQHAREQVPLTMAFFSDFVPERVEALLSSRHTSISWLCMT
ncbi:M56 family peptidase, partial [Pseudomonas aeruginosa]